MERRQLRGDHEWRGVSREVAVSGGSTAIIP